MNEMYNEGLILDNFTTDRKIYDKDAEYRKALLISNTGFATYDYNQTTVILNNKIPSGDTNPLVAKGYTPLLASALPAVAKWDGTNYSYFTESWRSVKSEGWFIVGSVADDADKLEGALRLFDFFYSDEGNQLMSYGPEIYLEHDENGNVEMMDYQGKQVPKLSTETLDELANLAGGNYTNYYRYWLGATLPVGYVKEQGMEYQTVYEDAKPALDNINKAIELGVLKHVNFANNNTDKWYNIVPTTFAYNTAESNQIANNYTDLDNFISNAKSKTNIYSTIVMQGIDAAMASLTTTKTEN